MAEDEYFPYVWGTNFLSGYFAFIHSKQKAGRTTWESFGQEPAIFNVMTPMYCEMLFNIMDEHKGPFAATTLGGGRVQARYLRWAMYMTVLNIMAGTRGLSKMGDMYADRAGDFHEFGNTMNTVWPIWNAAFTLYGLQMAYKAQMVEQRDQMVAVEKMMLEERDQLSSGELSRINKIIAVGRILECTKKLDLTNRNIKPESDQEIEWGQDMFAKLKKLRLQHQAELKQNKAANDNVATEKAVEFDQAALDQLANDAMAISDRWLAGRQKDLTLRQNIKANISEAAKLLSAEDRLEVAKYTVAKHFGWAGKLAQFARYSDLSPYARFFGKDISVAGKAVRLTWNAAISTVYIPWLAIRRVGLSVASGFKYNQIKQMQPIVRDISLIEKALAEKKPVDESSIKLVEDQVLAYSETSTGPASLARFVKHEASDQVRDFVQWEVMGGLKLLRRIVPVPDKAEREFRKTQRAKDQERLAA